MALKLRNRRCPEASSSNPRLINNPRPMDNVVIEPTVPSAITINAEDRALQRFVMLQDVG
jgi:hypothetical protein